VRKPRSDRSVSGRAGYWLWISTNPGLGTTLTVSGRR
jgi:hypothetical protein